jgi:hypothetical protein
MQKKMIIQVRGGTIQEIRTNFKNDVDVQIVDFDNLTDIDQMIESEGFKNIEQWENKYEKNFEFIVY